MKIENIEISKLKGYSRNAKKHPAEQVETIKKSISEFGFRNPVLIDNDNVVIAGHGRIMAAKELNIGELPCVRISDLTPDQVKAFRIMDNKSTESEWAVMWNEVQELWDGPQLSN